jgi:hypothetical protein
MSHRRRGMRVILHIGALIATFIATLGIPFALGYALGAVDMTGVLHYQNTSPPLTTTADNVTLSVDHSHYLNVDTITVTLTNHASTPIDVLCLNSSFEHLSAHGWKAADRACDWPRQSSCGGAEQLQPPTNIAVAPGQSILMGSYNRTEDYPPLSPGPYRFRIVYSLTSIQQTSPSARPKSVTSVTLTTAPMMVSSAWWKPPWYHQHLDCPRLAA